MTLLIWRGPHDHRRTEREGRTLRVDLQPNGTWHLTVWKSESSSVCVGVFAAPEVACLCAEGLPLSDAALAIVKKHPLSAFGGEQGIFNREPNTSEIPEAGEG